MDTATVTPTPTLTRQPRTRLPRYRRVDDFPPITIGLPRQRILQAVLRFHYLTAPQLARYSFSATSLTYVRTHLKVLYQAGYVERLYLPTTKPSGSPLAIYCLTSRGLAALRKLGHRPEGRLRPSEQLAREGIGLRHTLQANDFLISCHLLARQVNWISLEEMRTERELRQVPMQPDQDSTGPALIPDGWVDLHLRGRARMSLAIELDRGTHERRRFQRKVRAYCQAAHGEYQRVYGSDSLTVLFAVTVGEPRLSELLRWTESELRRSGREAHADLFRFAAVDPARIDSTELFFGGHWIRPFGGGPAPLLGESLSGESQRGEDLPREEGADEHVRDE